MRVLMMTVAVSMALAAPSGRVRAQASAPPPSDVTGTGDLSDKLKATGGVVHPEANDAAMQKVPPATTAPMPVVPPPGTPEHAPDVQPK